MTKKEFDVIIVGAGPAGCACALRLKDANLRVALIDKKEFPRDKVCGDAIPGRAVKTLQSISPAFAGEFKKFKKKLNCSTTKFFYKNQSLDFTWVEPAYTCARIDFDNFLVDLVNVNTKTKVFTNIKITAIKIENNLVTLSESTDSFNFSSKIVMGADGAQSVLAKSLANRKVDRDHYVGSVRAYYSNIENTITNTLEVYYDKKLLSSYFWIFPLPDNKANVGFGMLSSTISKNKVDINKAFYDFIKENPTLSLRFSNATQTSKLEGFGLPLGSKKVPWSGDNFLLAGDAASLIDPFSGEGIGNAMLSGKLAADQIIKSFQEDDFTATQLLNYEMSLQKAIGKELKFRYNLQKIIAKIPWLVDVIFAITKSAWIKRFIQKQL